MSSDSTTTVRVKSGPDAAGRWAAVAAALRRAILVLVSTYPTPEDAAPLHAVGRPLPNMRASA